MDELTMIITMAGEGTRFKKAGYTCPKYMISVEGKTLFDWSMESLADFNEKADKYIFITQKKHEAKKFIIDNCKKLGIVNAEVLELEHQTDGQATTCLKALDLCNEESAIYVYNIDTYVEKGQLKFTDICGDGFIPCFHADGEHWSFVRLDGKQRVVEVREKKRISDNCSLGAYYFSSAKLYQDLYMNYYHNGIGAEKECYIAPMYNQMIQKGYTVGMNLIDSEKVHVLGTPEEVAVFEKKLRLSERKTDFQ